MSKLLRDELGADWRNKLPLPSDHEVVMKEQRAPSVPVGQRQGSEKTTAEATVSGEMSKEQRLKKYEQLKEKGNGYVKKVRRVYL